MTDEATHSGCCQEHNKVVTWAKLLVLAAAAASLLNLLNVGFASSSDIEKMDIQIKRNRRDIEVVLIRVDKRLDYIQKRIDK